MANNNKGKEPSKKKDEQEITSKGKASSSSKGKEPAGISESKGKGALSKSNPTVAKSSSSSSNKGKEPQPEKKNYMVTPGVKVLGKLLLMKACRTAKEDIHEPKKKKRRRTHLHAEKSQLQVSNFQGQTQIKTVGQPKYDDEDDSEGEVDYPDPSRDEHGDEYYDEDDY